MTLRAQRRPDATRRVWVGYALAVAASACEARTIPVAQAAALDRLVGCAKEAERVMNLDRSARSPALASWLAQDDGCAREVFRGCVDLDAGPAPGEGPPERLLVAMCTRAYCGRFAAAPALCDRDGALTHDTATELLAAKLALDHGVDPRDPRIAAVARSYARFLAVEAMRDELPAAPRPLTLTVQVSAAGYTVRGVGIETTIIAADPNRPLVAPDRWDLAALARTARALKTSFPAESTVELEVGDEIPVEAVTRTMDALIGEGCAPPEAGDPDCLFWRPVVVPRR